jgi:hypothetical protein
MSEGAYPPSCTQQTHDDYYGHDGDPCSYCGITCTRGRGFCDCCDFCLSEQGYAPIGAPVPPQPEEPEPEEPR